MISVFTFFIQVNACGPHGWEAWWLYTLFFQIDPNFLSGMVCVMCAQETSEEEPETDHQAFISYH